MNNQADIKYSAVKTLKRLLFISKRYIPVYTLLCITAVIRSGVGLLDTEGFRRMLNGATGSNIHMVKVGITIGIVALILGLITDFIIDYYGEILNFVSTKDLQSKILKKVTKIKMIKYEGYHTGDLIDRLDNCANLAQTGLNTNLRMLLEKSLVIVFCIAYLIFLNFRLMISTLGFMILLPIIINPIAKVLRKLYDNTQTLRVEKDAFVQDSFQGAEIVRSFSLTRRLKKSFLNKINKYVKIQNKVLVFQSIMGTTHWIIILGGDLFILGYGGYLSSKGLMAVGDVVSFLLIFEKIMEPISAITTAWPQLQVSISSANKIFELLDLDEEETIDTRLDDNKADKNVNIYNNTSSKITFKDIRFGYDKETEVLKGINFSCNRDNVTALVGPSGGGKSTILKMLLRLYEPSDGTIKYGERVLESINPEKWRRGIAYVSQEPLLFSGTILENIKYGNVSVSEEEIISAAKAANIHETIMKTEEGYNSRIGEQGVRLSGGERQRVAIARAMLRNPSLLILDEPTSALDSENERLIQEALDKLMKGRTTIIVAHRLSTIQNADKIVYIEDGRVCEEGTHSELMEIQGKYFNIHEKIKQTSEIGNNSNGEGAAS